MCGLTGFWSTAAFAEGEAEDAARRMAQTLHHRGPDSGGVWTDRAAGVALAHRRLSILELTPAGAQPMLSASSRFVIAFNGEIYNHLDLRERLQKEDRAPSPWRGGSDTETLLACIDAWGVKATLQNAFGMFAFALWDRQQRTLCVARDRIGEKPLYLGRAGRTVLFASEVRAFRAMPGFEPVLNQEAVANYVRFGYVPEPLAIYQGVLKLPPGHFCEISEPASEWTFQSYWTLEDEIRRGRENPLDAGYDELCAAVETCLDSVVTSQMLSDVPLGCFLSGGIDSSLVAALMQKNSAAKVRTFSIGFELARFNESPHARAVADHLRTDHTEFILTERDALDAIPELAQVYDEPFADSSQIPTLLLSRLARQHVTVALTGDGGDEIFGGYNRYAFAPRLARFAAYAPKQVRWLVWKSTAALQATAGRENGALRRSAQALRLPVTAIDKLAATGESLYRADDLESLYREIVSGFPDPALVLNRTPDQRGDHSAHPLPVFGADLRLSQPEYLMAMDTLTYLPGDVLVKVDRASMNASLETRAPLLDARTLAVAWRLPMSAKLRGQTGKRILRDILSRHVPRHMIDRPKQGFAVPLDHWLRTDLKDWVEDTLAQNARSADGIFDQNAVAKLWNEHRLGRANHGSKLWTLLMFKSWQDGQAQ